ncbi:MAG: outer membrane lipoprotein-sorting protein [Bacillota bacterium]
MKKIKLLTALLVISTLVIGGLGTAVMAEDMTGEDILEKVDEEMDSESRDFILDMTIVNDNGEERDRKITIKTKGENKGLVKFLEPGDVQDTALLTVEENNQEDMWLYLPALGNVKKIASHNKNGDFMGTDFTYNDIDMVGGSNYEDDYDSELIAEEKIRGDMCYKLSTTPTKESIEYSEMKMWVRKDDYMPLKLEFFDKDGELQKVMTNENYRNIDSHLTPEKIVMEDVQKGTKTILELDEVEFNVELDDKIFTTRYLSRN